MKRLITAILLSLSLSTVSFAAWWSDWAAIPDGLAIGEPSVVTTKDGTIHVMVRGTDNALWWTRSKDGGKTWYGTKTTQKWTKVGGILTSSPSCLEPIPNVVECYVRNSEKGVSQIDRINDAWGPWAGVGGVIMTNISATAQNENVRQLYVVNSQGKIASNIWDGRNFTSARWLGWGTWDDEVGKNSFVACSDLGGNSQIDFGGDVEFQQNDRICVTNTPGGNLSLIKDFTKGNREILLNFAKATSLYPVYVRLHSVSTAMDLYFVDKDKQMKRGMYKFGTGWTGPFETIGNGTFTSGPSCDNGGAKLKATAVCAGRGNDGAVWYSIRRAGEDNTTIDPGTVGTGKVLFGAGNAGTNLNAMYGRPSAGVGQVLKLKTSEAEKCVSGSCYFNLGVILVRKNAVGKSVVSVLMTGSGKLQNGKPVVYASEAAFPKGTKTIAASVRVELNIGETTPVLVKIVPVGGNVGDANEFESFAVSVSVSK